MSLTKETEKQINRVYELRRNHTLSCPRPKGDPPLNRHDDIIKIAREIENICISKEDTMYSFK